MQLKDQDIKVTSTALKKGREEILLVILKMNEVPDNEKKKLQIRLALIGDKFGF